MLGSRGLVAVLALATATTTTISARADDAADKATAEALFRAAKELQAQKNYGEACPKFAESHRLDPKPGTVLNLATCHELEGRIATAWAEYGEATALASRARQAEREKFARGKVAELEKKLSYVRFTFSHTPGLEVLVDGKALSSAASGTRVPIDPGEHAIEAHAPDHEPWSSKLKVDPGPAETAIEIPALANATASAQPPPPPPPTPPAAEPPRQESGGSGQRTLGWIAAGVGVVGLGVGGVFGAKTLSEKSTVDSHCTGAFCDADGLSANDRAKSAATISTIGFIAGGVLVVGGLVLVLTAPSGKSAGTARPIRVGTLDRVW